MVDTTTIAVIIVFAIVLLGLVMFIMICKQINTESPTHAVRITQKQMRRQSRLLSSAFTKHHFTNFADTTPRNVKAPIPEESSEDGDDESDDRDSVEGGEDGTCYRGSLGQESGYHERDIDESPFKRGDDVTTQSEPRYGRANRQIAMTSQTGESDMTSQTDESGMAGSVNAGGDIVTPRRGIDSINNLSIFVTVPLQPHHDQPTDTVRVDIDQLPPLVSSKPDQPVYDYKKMELPSVERVDTHGTTTEESRGNEYDH